MQRRRSDGGWVGAHVGAESALAAYCAPAKTAEARPQIKLSPAFSGPTAGAELLAWTRQHAPASRTAIVLRASEYRIVPTETPAVPAAERAQALRWQIKDMLDFPADAACIDSLAIPAAAEGQRPNRLFAVATPNDCVLGFMKQYRGSGNTLGAVDIPEAAVRNLSVLAGGDGAHAFLHIGLRSSRLAMVWQRELCAFRQFDLSTTELSAALPLDRSMLLERIALEVQRTADAFVRQFHSAHLSTLWLCASDQGQLLEQELSDLLALKVRNFDVEAHLDLAGGNTLTNMATGADYTLVVGAALRAHPSLQ